MSDEDKKKVDPKSMIPTWKPGEPIAVRALHIDKNKNQLGIPGKKMGDSVVADPAAPTNRDRWAIFFLPQLRHHMVIYFKAGSDHTEWSLVHETNVTRWEPLLA
jgi:hypothetical protein